MNPISWWVCDQSSDQSCFSPAEWFHFCVLVIGAAGWSFVNPIRRLAATESLWETMRGRERAWGCVLGQGISVFHSLSGWFPERTGLSSPFLSLHTLTNILFFFSIPYLRVRVFWMLFASLLSSPECSVSPLSFVVPHWFLSSSFKPLQSTEHFKAQLGRTVLTVLFRPVNRNDLSFKLN